MAGNSPYQRILRGEETLYFAHVPKTAGTSFYQILDQRFAQQDICPWNTDPSLARHTDKEWRPFKLYRGHFGWRLHAKLERAPLMVTMVREPVARAISAIHHGMRDVDQRKHLPTTICEFVRLPDARERIASGYRDSLANYTPGMCTSEWVESAKQTLDKCLFVGLTERFDDSMALLAYKMGWGVPQTTAPLNRKPNSQQLSVPEDTLAILREYLEPTQTIYEHAQRRFTYDMSVMHRDLITRAQQLDVEPVERQSQVRFTFDQPLNGDGWYGYDSTALQHGVPMRWTGPGTASTLEFRLDTKRDLKLQAHLANAVTQDIVESLTLTVNNVPVPLELRSLGGRQVLATGHLRKELLRRDLSTTQLRFQVSHTASWQDLDAKSPDTQKRGVAFCQLSLTPCM